MLMVIFFHTLEVTDIGTALSDKIYFILYSIHVPAFLMASGYLFAGTIKRHSVSDIIKTRIADLGLVFVEWSLMFTVYNWHIFSLMGKSFGSIAECVGFSANNVWYLWFLLFCIIATIVIEKIWMPRGLIVPITASAVIISSAVSPGMAKLGTHYLVFWLGYSFRDARIAVCRIMSALYAVITILNIALNWFDTQTVVRGGIRMVPVMGYKVLGGMFLFMLFYDICNVFKCAGNNNVYASVGEKTLYLYILHFIPLPIYNCLGFRSWKAVFIGTACFGAFALFICRIVRGTFADKMFFRPSVIFKDQ